MFSVKKENEKYCLYSNGQSIETPNGNEINSVDEKLMLEALNFLNTNGLPDLGDVNVYNLLLTMVDNYPAGKSAAKAHLRKQLWRDPVFHTSPSRELEDARKHAIAIVDSWYNELGYGQMPKIYVEDAEDDDEEVGFFPIDELKAQWPNYNHVVKKYESMYNALNIRQKTVIACLSQTFDAFHLSLYLMFVNGKIKDYELADCLHKSYDLPLENIGQAVEGAADEDKEINLEEFEQYQLFLNY